MATDKLLEESDGVSEDRLAFEKYLAKERPQRAAAILDWDEYDAVRTHGRGRPFEIAQLPLFIDFLCV